MPRPLAAMLVAHARSALDRARRVAPSACPRQRDHSSSRYAGRYGAPEADETRTFGPRIPRRLFTLPVLGSRAQRVGTPNQSAGLTASALGPQPQRQSWALAAQRRFFLAVPVVLGLGVLASPATAAHPVYADYDSELRESTPRPDGIRHVDTPALVARLLELNVTTYAFLLYHETSDYADLADEFLPAAEQAGLEVWAYLVPPTELPGDYPPCQSDYVCWGQLMGQLAEAHPALSTIVMDDFNGNVDVFTPAYVRQMMDAAHASAPALRFYALDYYPWLLTDFLRTDYRGAVDGIVHAYRDLDTTNTLSSELDQLCMVTKRKAELRLHVPGATPTVADDYVALSKTVPVTAAAASVRFDMLDSFFGATSGYHFFQVLIDGSVVYELDVAGTEPNPHHELDVSAAVSGKAEVELGIRIYDQQAATNFPLDLFI